MRSCKEYIGDGVYADFDGSQIVLTCENRIEAYERIVLEYEVVEALLSYIERIKGIQNATQNPNQVPLPLKLS